MDNNSKFDRINTFLQTIASFATTIGVILVVWQVVIARQAFEAQEWQVISGHMNEIDKIFIEHPDLYPYFYQKKSINTDDPQYPKVAAMAEMILDFMDGFEDDYVRGLVGMEEYGSSWLAWKNYFEDQFRLSPILCNRFKEIESWYIKDGVVYSLAKNGCSKADSSQEKQIPSSSNTSSGPNVRLNSDPAQTARGSG